MGTTKLFLGSLKMKEISLWQKRPSKQIYVSSRALAINRQSSYKQYSASSQKYLMRGTKLRRTLKTLARKRSSLSSTLPEVASLEKLSIWVKMILQKQEKYLTLPMSTLQIFPPFLSLELVRK